MRWDWKAAACACYGREGWEIPANIQDRDCAADLIRKPPHGDTDPPVSSIGDFVCYLSIGTNCVILL